MSQILKTLKEYEVFRRTASSVQRIQNVDLASQSDTDSGGDETKIPFCHIVVDMPFSIVKDGGQRVPFAKEVFQSMAASMLAIEHLNTGNGTLVEQVEGLNHRCDLKFTIEVFDTELSDKVAVNQVIAIVSRSPERERLPCAFLGAARSAVSAPTSIITGLKGYPQISPISTSDELDDRVQFPLFGRTIPANSGTAGPVILYLRFELGVTHLAVLHVNGIFGTSYAWALREAAKQHAPDMVIQTFDFPFDATEDSIEHTIQDLKETQYRYFFGIFFGTQHYQPFMIEAYKQGIAGTGNHTWYFSGSVTTSIFTEPFQKGSPLQLASTGISLIGAVGGVPGILTYDRFLHTLKDMDNSLDVALIQSRHPTYEDIEANISYKPLQIAEDPFFFTSATAGIVAFAYDATIALGLSACSAAEATATDTRNKTRSYFDGKTHFEKFKTTTFHGVSGTNEFDAETGTRMASSARFTITNIVLDETNSPYDQVRFKTVETHIFERGKWNQKVATLFSDGTTSPPPDLPPVTIENNYIGKGLQWTGVIMQVVVLGMIIYWVAWTYAFRGNHVVKASQPIFLHLVTLGCLLMSSSIMFLVLDDEVTSTNFCTAACMVVPWLISLGWILVFSALFAKTNRVNQIFHNPTRRHIKVTVSDVMIPIAVLLTITLTILTTWTATSPPTWERAIADVDIFDRTVATRGYCNFDGTLPFAAVLTSLLLGVLGYAIYEAYVARHVSTEFAESNYIFLILSTVLLTSFLAFPTLVLAAEHAKAKSFIAIGTIFLLCVAILLLIFVPKVLAYKKSMRTLNTEFVHSRTRSTRAFRLSNVGGVSVTGLGMVASPSPHLDTSGRVFDSGSGFPTSYRIPNLDESAVASESGTSRSQQEMPYDSTTESTPPVESLRSGGGSDEAGILVLQHPKDIEGLRRRVQVLEKENKEMRMELHNTSIILEQRMSETSVVDA